VALALKLTRCAACLAASLGRKEEAGAGAWSRRGRAAGGTLVQGMGQYAQLVIGPAGSGKECCSGHGPAPGPSRWQEEDDGGGGGGGAL